MSSGVTSIFSQDNLNSPNLNQTGVYEFDRFRLDAGKLMLYENDNPIALAPKVIETLVALIERRGDVVSKNELMNRLWADSFVEEANLTQNIYLLRKTLGKDADGRDLIETFRRRGYRFSGKIAEKIEPAAIETPINADATVEISIEKTAGNSINRNWVAAAAAAGLLIVLLAAAVIAFRRFADQNTQAQAIPAAASSAPPNLKITRLTPDVYAYASEFTPDGKYLVYTLREKGKRSVWLKDLTTGEATLVLPPTDTAYDHPRFSRDGKTIYYITARPNKPNGTFVRVPRAGGTLAEIVSNVIGPVAVSPDEKQIVFINGDDGQPRIADIDGGGERVLARRDPKKGWFESWGSYLSWSPDGSTVAVCGGRYGAGGRRSYELILLNAATGAEQIVPTPDWNYLDDVRWLGDGTGFIVTARETEVAPFQLWRVSYPDGATRRITNDLNHYDDIALSPDSRRLVTNQKSMNLNVWLAPTDAPARPRQITFGNSAEDGYFGIAFTPDGKIIYTSPRGGNVDLWQMNADGDEQKQLTKNAGEWNARPQITPDGRTIVFVSTRTGARQIWRMDADGGNPKQLTDVFLADHPNLSPDGKWIYFSLYTEDVKAFVAKIPIDGGEAVRIPSATERAAIPSISPDGRLIFYSFYEEGSAQPWRHGLMSAETDEHLKSFAFQFGGSAVWNKDSNSILHVRGTMASNLFQISLDETEQKQLTNFESGHIRTFAVSPDNRQIAFSRGNPSVEAILISGF